MDALPRLLRDGYLWRPGRGRLAGLRFTGVRGTDGLQFFYDEKNIRRAGAVPEPILSTLFGHGAVHTLDGDAHRHRKAMFTGLLMPPEAVAGLTVAVMKAWEAERPRWARAEEVVIFDASARVLTRAVTGWAGLDVPTARSTVSETIWSLWWTGSVRPAGGTGGRGRPATAGRSGWPTS